LKASIPGSRVMGGFSFYDNTISQSVEPAKSSHQSDLR
jgi:hypothetical protein